jgi:hypothetical protein
MDPLLLQKQVRDNAEDLRNYMQDLRNWEADMKRKESELQAAASGDQVCVIIVDFIRHNFKLFLLHSPRQCISFLRPWNKLIQPNTLPLI